MRPLSRSVALAIKQLEHYSDERSPQGGLLSGKDPTAFNTADPLRIWIIQVGKLLAPSSIL